MGLTAEMREALAARVRFYRELGIAELYPGRWMVRISPGWMLRR